MKIKRLTKRNAAQFALHAILWAMLFMMLYPLAMAMWNAFKTPDGFIFNKWVPSLPLRIGNLATGFELTKVYIANTLFVGTVGIAGMLFLSSMASFAISKTRIKFRKVMFAMILAIMMIPGVLTLVPSYLLYSGLGLYNSMFALIIPMWTGGSVFSVFLLVNMFKSIPGELFEAAAIDGAGTFKRYALIALPLSAPIIGTVIIMSIVSVWNDLVWPLVILEEGNYTISAGLKLTFREVFPGTEPVMYSAYLIASAPLILLFIFANRFYIQGLMSTSIKM